MRPSFVAPVLVVAVVVACGEQDMSVTELSVPDTGRPNADGLSPLEEYLGEGAVSFEGGFALSRLGTSVDEPIQPSENMLRQHRELEQLIAKCMRDEGFEYVTPTDLSVPAAVDEALALPADEFAATYGYGISTIHPDVERQDNPNDAIIDAMTPAEHEAYQIAMHGVQANGWSENTPPLLSESGCAGKATEQVFGDLDEYGRDLQWEALASKLEALDSRIDNDPRVIEAERSWLACMAEAGYPGMDDIGGGRTLLANRIDEIRGIEGSEMLLPWSETDPGELRALQQFEIEVATADRACMTEHFDEIFRDVRFELEAEFVEQHRDELEQHRERLPEGQ